MSVIAVAVSDVHLSHRPPLVRSAEPNWYGAMARPLIELKLLCRRYEVPLLIGGDLFDKWNPPPELINFALEMFEPFDCVYSIPGQHDLRHHQYSDLDKTAYWTLDAAGGICDIDAGSSILIADNKVAGYPWGFKPDGRDEESNIALLHAYCWQSLKHHYSSVAPDDGSQVEEHRRRLVGQSLAIFGDNHHGFVSKPQHKTGTVILNCGALMRRRVDEIKYNPRAWLIDSNCKPHPVSLDLTQDSFVDFNKDERKLLKSLEVDSFIDGLTNLEEGSIDFGFAVRDALKRNRDRVSPRVVKMILKVIESDRE